MQTLRRFFAIAIVLMIILIAGVVFVYRSIPSRNTDLTHFDTIIVLGTPANSDGTPSPEQRERTLEGIREYKAGVAPVLIFTGSAAHNDFVEAHVMATLALAQGVHLLPSSKKIRPKIRFRISSTATALCKPITGPALR